MGIVERVSIFVQQTRELEKNRADIIGELEEEMRKVIIPEVEPLLEAGYTIDRRKSNVACFGESCNKIPTDIWIELRLLYNKQPIFYNDISQELSDLKEKLKPKLNQIAERYNVYTVQLMGEPEHIG